MDNYSAAEIIEQAVQTEKLGYEFYTVMAKRFETSEKLQKLFETLAIKEREHERTFAALKERIGNRMLEGWDEASMYLRAVVESEFFLGKHKSLPSLENLESVDEAVRYAMGFERETLLYYYGLRDVIKDRDIINEIINEEKSHILWLSEFKKSLMDQKIE